jgi:hypothetical protein
MVVKAQSKNTRRLNAPTEAARKLPMPMLARARGNVRGRAAEIQALAFTG